MAINGTNKQKNTGVPNVQEFNIHPSGQVNPWRATPASLRHQLPGYASTSALTSGAANAVLINRSSASKPAYLRNMYLFVESIGSGWQVAGDLQQAHTSRTFYPKHIAQNDLVITGTMPSQYDFDRLVEFVQHHHHTAISDMTHFSPQELLQHDQFAPVIFRFYKDPTRMGRFAHVPSDMNWTYTVLINTVDAGHERFKFAPAFTLPCKVIQNGDISWQRNVDISKKLQSQRIWGQFDSARFLTATDAGRSPRKTVYGK